MRVWGIEQEPKRAGAQAAIQSRVRVLENITFSSQCRVGSHGLVNSRQHERISQ